MKDAWEEKNKGSNKSDPSSSTAKMDQKNNGESEQHQNGSAGNFLTPPPPPIQKVWNTGGAKLISLFRKMKQKMGQITSDQAEILTL